MTKQSIPTEHWEGKQIADYCRQRYIECWHIPQETYTPYHSVRNKNKAAGVRPGISDYCIIIQPHQSKYGMSHMLFIELKRSKKSLSRVSESQENFINIAQDVKGVEARICYGHKPSIEFINEYYQEPTNTLGKKDLDEFTDWLHKNK